MIRLPRSHFFGALCLLIVLGSLARPLPARASGFELLPGGTRSVMRGGAVAARFEDPMVLLHNPAGLSSLSGNRVMLNIDTAIHEMCVDPYGYYGWGVYSADFSEFDDPLDDAYATTPLPKVCNSAEVLPLPALAFATQLSDDVTIGFGMVAPTLVTGVRYGGADGTIAIDGVAYPTPTRYQVIERTIDFGLVPSFGLAYRFSEMFALGANLQVTMVSAKTWAVQNETSGTQPSSDWLAEVSASDYFIPSITLGAHIKPLRSIDLSVVFRLSENFDGSGDVRYETATFHDGATSGPIPYKNDPIDLSSINIGLPWALTLGARYAGLLSSTPAPNADAMDSERWDVEVDATYTFGALASENTVQPGDDVTIISRIAGGGTALTPTETLPEVKLDRHQLDSIAVRLGGSYSFIPRTLAAHAGAFFESRGVEASYATVDSFAFARIGMGVGVALRFGSFDLMAAYGHIFQETLEVVPPEHQNVEDHDPDDVTSGFDQRIGGTFTDAGVRSGGRVLADPDVPSEGDATAKLQQSSPLPSPARPERIINAGKYTASFDIISVGVQYRY